MPSRPTAGLPNLDQAPKQVASSVPPHDEVLIPAGTFQMGDSFGEGYPADGEVPVHAVELGAFRMDATAVTNEQFAAFVDATGYTTEAERYGTSAVFHLVVQAQRKDIIGEASGAPWWLTVKGADWAHPTGLGKHWSEISHHPVVQVSHDDALAYCRWAGCRLPTEAEWEYAARGGLEQQHYPWGSELLTASVRANPHVERRVGAGVATHWHQSSVVGTDAW